MLFNPNTTCVLIKNTGYNAYGEQTYSKEPITEPCALLDAKRSMKKSSVRADSSASRGNAQEITADFWLILLPTTEAEIDDLIEIHGTRVKIIDLIPRYGLDGHHDHTEAMCQMWNDVEDD